MHIKLDILESLGVAIIAFILGQSIKNKVGFFRKFFIPSPVIGGIIISFLNLLLSQTELLYVEFDEIIQDFFMNIFFTSIGLSCSFKLLKKSGWLGLKLALAIIVLLPLQNLVGVGISKLLGINPLHGIAMGSTSMTGGIGSAVSFGKIMEGYGAANSTTIGVASATFGLLIGSLVGGPTAKKLIRKHNLKSSGLLIEKERDEVKNSINQQSLMRDIVIIALASFLGTFINRLLAFTPINFPYYVGCQFGGLVVRNIYDGFRKDVAIDNVEILGNISLNLFLALSLINLNIGAILGLALPMFIIMFGQAIFISLYTRTVTFNLTGRNYDASVMVAGHCGVGLGQTPNAIANMEAIIEEEGPADVAMFVFPIVLAIAVNFFNPIVITFFINSFS